LQGGVYKHAALFHQGSVMPQATREIGAILRLVQAHDLRNAESQCRILLAQEPAHAQAVHLLGLILKDTNRASEGEQLIRSSIALLPACAEFHANLGKLLRRQQRFTEALFSLRTACALSRDEATVSLIARTLGDLGRHAEAETECRGLVATTRTAAAWSALGVALRAQGKVLEAEAAYREALAVSPEDQLSNHNLGALLSQLERAEEALGHLDRAAKSGGTSFELAFNRARALMQLSRLEESQVSFEKALALKPTDPLAHSNLARLRFMRGDIHYARDLEAVASRSRDATLVLLLAQIRRQAGELEPARRVLEDAVERQPQDADYCSALAGVLHDLGELPQALNLAQTASRTRPDDPLVIENLVGVLLSLGRDDEALQHARAQRRRAPLDQRWLAYEATASRTVDPENHAVLYDFERLVRSYDVEPPPGWTIESFNAAVLATLEPRHVFDRHPFDQSLRNGSQTARCLTQDHDANLRALLRAFEAPLTDYLSTIGRDAGHAITSRNTGTARMVGCWSVQLRRDGFHVNHVHPQGWISSAYYVSVPPEVADVDVQSGWLRFGEPRFFVPGATIGKVVQPRPGRLVLFPSCFWHGTAPIRGAEPRTAVAFDALPV